MTSSTKPEVHSVQRKTEPQSQVTRRPKFEILDAVFEIWEWPEQKYRHAVRITLPTY